MTVVQDQGGEDACYYDSFYYRHGCGTPYERNEAWQWQFRRVADRIVSDLAPGSVLDAGCAIGLLVEALVERGVDAHGVDISPYAIGRVHESVSDRCRVGSILEPFGRRYDLVVTIEVLEHLKPHEAEAAVANLCAHADDVLFSSTPNDFKETSHFNVRPPEYWAELFARQGFYRDLDHDGLYLTPWAVRFRKEKMAVPRLVSGYERKLWLAHQEACGTRSALIDCEASLARAEADVARVEGFEQRLADRYAAEAALATEFNRSVTAWSAHVQGLEAVLQGFRDELARTQQALAAAEGRAADAERWASACEESARFDREAKAELEGQMSELASSRAWRLAQRLSGARRRVAG